MKGVNVNITISLDVNTVSIDIRIYNTINNFNWELWYLDTKRLAIYVKKPASSNVTDKNDTEINNINIFKGLREEFAVTCAKNVEPASLIIINNIIAPNKTGIQNVSTLMCPIFNFGKTKIQRNIPIIADSAIMDAKTSPAVPDIIITNEYYILF